MAKTRISEWSSTPANNTDIDSINIAEGCAPSGINDAIRELMSQVKDLYAGTSGDIIAVAAGGTGVGTSTGSGNNVLSTSPTLVTPALGTPSALVGTNITGTAANFNINGTVGATTANTGAFTTLSASSTVTLSGGTANGVTYLNGSKVLTSGSALVFDGTNLGVGVASPGCKLQVSNGSGCQFYVGLSNNIYSQAYNHIWQYLSGASTYMTLNESGNLGLGVTPSAWDSVFKVLQVGVTNAYISGRSGSVNQAQFGLNNHYASGNYVYTTTGFATKYEQNSGGHYWYYAPSGTAGNPITFTQAMTLDASGNLGVATTTPTAKFVVGSGNTLLGHNTLDNYGGNVDIRSAYQVRAANTPTQLFVADSAGSQTIDKGGAIDLGGYTDSFSRAYTYARIQGLASASTGFGGYLSFSTISGGGGVAERARFNSTGAFVFAGGTTTADGIGITFPATQQASSNANTLDDYEEGTWTPTDNSGASLSFTGVSATYTKVGRLVTCLCELNYPVTASGASASIAGLPFTSANTQANRSGGVMTISTTAAVQRIYPVINNTTFPLLNGTGAAATNATCSGAQFNFCITFYT